MQVLGKYCVQERILSSKMLLHMLQYLPPGMQGNPGGADWPISVHASWERPDLRGRAQRSGDTQCLYQRTPVLGRSLMLHPTPTKGSSPREAAHGKTDPPRSEGWHVWMNTYTSEWLLSLVWKMKFQSYRVFSNFTYYLPLFSLP